jgi:hypothetical protein
MFKGLLFFKFMPFLINESYTFKLFLTQGYSTGFLFAIYKVSQLISSLFAPNPDAATWYGFVE